MKNSKFLNVFQNPRKYNKSVMLYKCPYDNNKCGNVLSFPCVCKIHNVIMCPDCRMKHEIECKFKQMVRLEDYIVQIQIFAKETEKLIIEKQSALKEEFKLNNNEIGELESERVNKKKDLDEKLANYERKIEEERGKMEGEIAEKKDKLIRKKREIINKNLFLKESEVALRESNKTIRINKNNKNYLEVFSELQYYATIMKNFHKPSDLYQRHSENMTEIKSPRRKAKTSFIFNITPDRFILSDIQGTTYFNENINNMYPFKDVMKNTQLKYFSSIRLDTNIFICGGQIESASSTQELSNKTYQIKCHPSALNVRQYTQSVQHLPDMLYPKIFNAIVASLKVVYILGGCRYKEGEFSIVKDCEAYMSEEGRWVPLPPLNKHKQALGCCILEDKIIYAFGGMSNNGSEEHEIETLAITRRIATWKYIKTNDCRLLVPDMKAFPISKSSIILFGGVLPGNTLIYSLIDNKIIQQKDTLIDTFRGKTSTFADGKIYIPGFASTQITQLYAYNIKNGKWTTPISHQRIKSRNYVAQHAISNIL